MSEIDQSAPAHNECCFDGFLHALLTANRGHTVCFLLVTLGAAYGFYLVLLNVG